MRIIKQSFFICPLSTWSLGNDKFTFNLDEYIEKEGEYKQDLDTDYAPFSPDYHPDGTFGPDPPGERTKGYERTEDGNIRIFKLDLPETMPSIDDLETTSEPIKSDFDMALEDAELDFDTLDDI